MFIEKVIKDMHIKNKACPSCSQKYTAQDIVV